MVAGRLVEAGALARQGLFWSVLIGLPITVIGLLLTPTLIGLFGLAPDVSQVGIDYLAVTMSTITTLTMMLLIGGVLRGIGDSRTPMIITAVANVINVIASAALIFGWAGLPALGAVGSAWGSVVARLIGAILLAGILWRGRNGVRAGGGGLWWPQLSVLRDILRIGMPAAVEEVLIIGAIASLTPVVATLGTIPLAAHRVAINVLSFIFTRYRLWIGSNSIGRTGRWCTASSRGPCCRADCSPLGGHLDGRTRCSIHRIC